MFRKEWQFVAIISSSMTLHCIIKLSKSTSVAVRDMLCHGADAQLETSPLDYVRHRYEGGKAEMPKMQLRNPKKLAVQWGKSVAAVYLLVPAAL